VHAFCTTVSPTWLPVLMANSTLVPNSTLDETWVHVLLIVPPVLGLIFAMFQWRHVVELEITGTSDDTDSPRGARQLGIAENQKEPLTDKVGPLNPEDLAHEMTKISNHIAEGAKTFLFVEYLYMAVYVFVFSILIVCFYNFTGTQPNRLALGLATMCAFIIGALTSIVSGYIGMSAAVMCNVRTAHECWVEGFAEGLDVALRGGSIMGFGLCSLGVLVLYALIMVLSLIEDFKLNSQDTALSMCEALAGFGLGASSIALFGRVGGGIYTKAADVGADLSGKNEYGMEEDDPRNPACIADNVGDNVGDIAGMGADLFGSFAESTVAALVIAAKAAKIGAKHEGISTNLSALLFPVIVSSSGILVGIITMLIILAFSHRIASELSGIETTLKLILVVSTVIQTPVIIGLGLICLPAEFALEFGDVTNWACIGSILMGLWAGLLIGLVTEYYTSHSYQPVRDVSESQVTSAATGIIYGLALGYVSCIVPVVALAIIIVIAHTFCGMYGIALAALGMLSTLTVGLTIDAYGPISDNAGGIAEMAGLPAHVRVYTDALDAAGNTTAAIGKGFAIGSAALVALALFGAFKARAQITHVDVSEPWTFAGLLIGALLPYAFSAMTMKSVGEAANDMVQECMSQFPDIVNNGVEPDYEKCIKISTQASLKEMIAPGLLVILSPILAGLIFGQNACAGLLCGSLVSGVQLAISMSNTGGAWDNSKKYIKSGGLEEEFDIHKGSVEYENAHKNSVTGDTVGDPLKDTSGPSLNILVKLSAITSLVFADVIHQCSAVDGGPYFMS